MSDVRHYLSPPKVGKIIGPNRSKAVIFDTFGVQVGSSGQFRRVEVGSGTRFVADCKAIQVHVQRRQLLGPCAGGGCSSP